MNVARSSLMWVVAIALVAIFVGGTALIARGDIGQVNQVSVTGNVKYVNFVALQRVTKTHLTHSKSAGDLLALREKILMLPWVKNVVVAKEYPDLLVLNITEHVAILRQPKGELLNEDGEGFGVNLNDYKKSKPKAYKAMQQLPLLDAPGYAKDTAWSKFHAVQKRLAVSEFKLQALQLDERGSWQMTLRSGLVLKLGSESVLKRLQVFLAIAAPRLKAQLSRLRYVDLRYSNGFAVMRKERS